MELSPNSRLSLTTYVRCPLCCSTALWYKEYRELAPWSLILLYETIWAYCFCLFVFDFTAWNYRGMSHSLQLTNALVTHYVAILRMLKCWISPLIQLLIKWGQAEKKHFSSFMAFYSGCDLYIHTASSCFK